MEKWIILNEIMKIKESLWIYASKLETQLENLQIESLKSK